MDDTSLPSTASPLYGSLHSSWRNFTSGLCSPDLFIDFGFYFMIGAALQRRVWTGPSHMPVFPNPYVVFVGDPGTGKGLVTTAVYKILSHHLLPLRNTAEVVGKRKQEKLVDNALKDASKKEQHIVYRESLKAAHDTLENAFTDGASNGMKSMGGSKDLERPLLFPIAANATTFEKLIMSIAASLRRKDVPESVFAPNGVYMHSSMCFILDELASIFKKNSEEVIHLLQEAYNCNEVYDYETIKRGKDRIKRPCVSIIGGTQQDYINQIFKHGIMNQGWASRTWFIVDNKPRFFKFMPDELTEPQKKDGEKILARVKELSSLYGHAPLTSEAQRFCNDWCHDYLNKPRITYNEKLKDYYARMQLHIMKLATAVHFADSNSMLVEKKDCVSTVDLLTRAEVNMAQALQGEKLNVIAKHAPALITLLTKSGPKTFMEIWAELSDSLKEAQVRELLKMQEDFGMIKQEPIKGIQKYKVL